jgi:hypothetical protein
VAHAPAHRCGQAEDTRARASNIEIGQFMIAGESPATELACRRCEADPDHPIEAAPGAKLIRINMAQRASRYFFADE